MESDLPKKFNELVLRESVKGTSLRKRSKEEDVKTDEPKGISIKNRIKVREDVNAKKIKTENGPEVKQEEKPVVKVEENQEKTKKEPSKVKCRHWPSCKNKECPYVHPKELV